jgi:hypothetical protein
MADLAADPTARPSAWGQSIPVAARAVALALAAAFSMSASAIEEPAYEVVRSLGEAMEIRAYAPYVVAEVVVPGPAADAGNRAFPILAGYIFGRNQGQRKFAMTAPVTQAPVDAPQAGTKLAMTAPVTQTPAGGGYQVQFVLPTGVALDEAPLPLDARVQLRQQPAQHWAAIRYSGTWSQANQAEHTEKLRTAVAAAGLVTIGEPVLARFNGPWTPWFMRRNEIWLRLAPDAATTPTEAAEAAGSVKAPPR